MSGMKRIIKAGRILDPASGRDEPGVLYMAEGKLVAPFEEAVLALEVGAVSAPVQTQFGWHVIKLNETRIKDAPSLDEVRNQLVEELRIQAVEEHIASLTDGAEITKPLDGALDPMILNDASLLEE